MPKVTFTPKAPLEKLNLAVRKDIRDEWDGKRADLESQVADILGFPVSFKFDVNAVWAYSSDPNGSGAGSTFRGYAEGFVYAVKSFIEKYGDIGKEYFKNAVSKSEVALVVDERGEQGETISADVKDGVFRIRFKQDRLGYNTGWLNDPFVIAINEAPHDGFCLRAKHSIQVEYNDEIEEVQEQIGKILNMTDVVLDPNFEENYKKLLKKEDKDWEITFGKATLAYFQDGIKYQLNYQGFDKDDMLQEGFAEGVPSKTIRIRIVDKMKSGSTLETVIEDGVVNIQMCVDKWWYNVSSAGEGLVDLL